jgi:hypothetical protein
LAVKENTCHWGRRLMLNYERYGCPICDFGHNKETHTQWKASVSGKKNGIVESVLGVRDVTHKIDLAHDGWVCGHCNNNIERRQRVCDWCGCKLISKPKRKRRNSRTKGDEALLNSAQTRVDDIIRDIARKMTALKKQQKRVKYYTAKLEGRLKKSVRKSITKPIRKVNLT